MTKCPYCKNEIEDFPQEFLPFIPKILFPESYKCGKEKYLVTFENEIFHSECLPSYLAENKKYKDYKTLPINIPLNLTLNEILDFISDLQSIVKASHKPTKNFLLKLSQIVCEQNSEYLQCANLECNKLLLRKNAIIGEKTKAFQSILIKQQSEQEIKPDDEGYKKNGKPYKVHYFCSQKCDGYFASKLQHNLQSIIDVARKNIEEIKDRTKRNIEVYENSSRDKEDIEKTVKQFEMMKRIKINNEMLNMAKAVKETTKKVLG